MEDGAPFGYRQRWLRCLAVDFAGRSGVGVAPQRCRARAWFGQGLTLLPHLDRRSAACAGAMAGIYVRLLGRIEANPGVVLHRRVSLPAWEKAWLGVRALAGSTPLDTRPREHPARAREAAA